ncbi:lysophospholipase L1-like esterase [Prosthecobacter fusiformis]|uniref:Lysophospholipase L1-like esterase n=1 Tax=Prosthecobacter fusiformis TaxID=48464 RepID=A0A4R7SQ42_9BACT|nr:SGNH/GDSL hydrolase family protein [Prosthecobacter fusiformis]TDU81350.1 lysophospholipase L1-like esterase [Prosthecobacter fusiformis]
MRLLLRSLSVLLFSTLVIRSVEPTNAKELAEKKVAAQKDLSEKFALWKATLPPEQQAWETVLEENLGMGFYLPIYQREKLEGKVTAWDYVEDDPKLPRVLLIGDSISRGYTLATRKALAGTANLHRAPENCGPTTNGLKKLSIWLGQGKWDIIHFNFGIHDRKTPLADYEQRLDAIATQLKATGATVIWASTTPVAEGGMKDATNADIIARNEVAARVMQKHGISINDLYTWIQPDLTTLQNPKDVHFSNAGYTRMAEKVAGSITKIIPTLTTVNTAIIPVGKLEKDGYEWEQRHAEVMEIKDSINPEIILIGDSITHFWGGQPSGDKKGTRGTESWHTLFSDRRVLNLGFGWDRTQNVLKRIQLGELDGLTPKTIIIHIGTNNTSKTVNARNNTPAEIAEGITLIIEKAQTKCPGAKIILMAIFPRGKSATEPRRALLKDINQRLAPLGSKPGVTFLDITEKWLEPDGTLSKDIMPDGVHPSQKGYAIWAEALKAHLP